MPRVTRSRAERLEQGYCQLRTMARRRGYTLDEPLESVGGGERTMRVYGRRRANALFVAAFESRITAETLRRRSVELLSPLPPSDGGEMLVALVSTSQRTFDRTVRALVDAINDGASTLRYELWSVDELQVDVVGHTLVPHHEVVTRDALPPHVTPEQCERMLVTEPVARRLDLRVGTLVAIDRVDSQSGTERIYRRVVDDCD